VANWAEASKHGATVLEDLRSRIVAVGEAGASYHVVAKQFSVSVTCIIKLMQRVCRIGSVAPEPRGRRPMIWPDTMRWSGPLWPDNPTCGTPSAISSIVSSHRCASNISSTPDIFFPNEIQSSIGSAGGRP
jgi:hypothetical protein